jgi:hypothetical protein
MFFVTLLLADILAWTRTQPGTGTLRAILYIDELFGYMPPVANPPSKTLLLTLLKQARAFGVGVVLSTQNPVDLDYRGLSNTGTWFIGRLQTERDKMRVMEGLEGASGAQPFDRGAMEQTIAGLGKRVFLMHSVHEPAPQTFETRWTMSYLAGPMTREQIKALQARTPEAASGATTAYSMASAAASAPAASATATARAGSASSTHAPVLPPDVPQFFVPPANGAPVARYEPAVLAVGDIAFTSIKYGVTEQRRVALLGAMDDGAITLDWDGARRSDLEPTSLERAPREGASFGALPRAAALAKSYAAWGKAFQKWLVTNEKVELFQSEACKLVSEPGESERDFRIRLQVVAREVRDAKIAALRGKYTTRFTTLQEKIRRAEQAVSREAAQASQANMNTALAVGGAILGAIFGRGRIGAGTIGKVSTAARGAGRAVQERGDVARASETVEALRAQQSDLETALQADIDALGASYDASTEALARVVIPARTGDVHVPLVALVWLPYDA